MLYTSVVEYAAVLENKFLCFFLIKNKQVNILTEGGLGRLNRGRVGRMGSDTGKEEGRSGMEGVGLAATWA